MSDDKQPPSQPTAEEQPAPAARADAPSSVLPPSLPISPAPRLTLTETSEKLAYLIALIVGSAAIFIGKISGWLGPWPGAIFAVACIVAYFALAWIANRENRMRADRLGDNCYYLGLVYTLSSLMATLYQIDRGADIEALLGNFGLALISTAVGIIARLIMIQLRSETDDIDAQARLSLAQTANLMKTDLIAAATAFRTLIVGAHETLNISVQQTEASFAAAKALSDKMASLEVSPEDLNSSLRQVVSHLEKAAERIGAAGADLKGQSQALSTSATAVERTETGLQRIDAILVELTKTLEEQRQATRNTITALQDQQEQLRKYREAMETDARKAREAVEKVYSALGDLAHTIVKRVKP